MRKEQTVKDVDQIMLKGNMVRGKFYEFFDGPLNVVGDRESKICAVAGVNVQVLTEECESSVYMRQTFNEMKSRKAFDVDECRP